MANNPETGFIRVKHIVGDPNAEPPIPAITPVSKSTWWDGVKTGHFPQPVKLGVNTTAWRAEDIRKRSLKQAGLDNSKTRCLMSANDPKRT